MKETPSKVRSTADADADTKAADAVKENPPDPKAIRPELENTEVDVTDPQSMADVDPAGEEPGANLKVPVSEQSVDGGSDDPDPKKVKGKKVGARYVPRKSGD